jgi:fructan beta-fructosidase
MKRSLLICIAAVALRALSAADDVVIEDFEGRDYGTWKTTGEAFGPGPAHGTLPGQMAVDGFKGKGLVNSFYHGDATTGTLTSPSFKIERKYIGFLIGGGKDIERTAINLLVDGKIVHSATGPNDKPGGSERLIPDSWDVTDLLGKAAVIEIVDNATGGWGHINVDQIIQSDRKPPSLLPIASREFVGVDKRYLNLPIKNNTPTRKVRIRYEGPDGAADVTNDIALADEKPDWWTFVDVSAARGGILTVDVNQLPEDSNALAAMELSNEILHAGDLYGEPLRQQFHFSARRGWNNDPNGLAFYRGEYHLFFQHNPYGWPWGNMHWGHAVSKDLVHWIELSEALAPDKFGPMFSGSAVVDWKNTSGLGRDGQPPLVLFYTAAGEPTVQCMASSIDGRHFTKYEHNPIVPQFTSGNRDPKVIWHEPTKKWVMTLYVETNKVHTIHFLGSPNLKDWTVLSRVDGFFECPDFFELALDDDSSKKKWILTAASSEYLVGTFNGITFTPETPKLPGHRGKGFYAAQTYSDIPESDGRRIQIGWFQTETKGMPFNQSMTIPVELKLVSTADGPRLTRTPIKELESLRATTSKMGDILLEPGRANPFAALKQDLVELLLDIERDDATEVSLNVRGASIIYDIEKGELVVNNHRSSAPFRKGKQHLAIYCDRASLEVFASDGLTYIPMPFIPKADELSLGIETKGGDALISNIRIYNLRSAWSEAASGAIFRPSP